MADVGEALARISMTTLALLYCAFFVYQQGRRDAAKESFETWFLRACDPNMRSLEDQETWDAVVNWVNRAEIVGLTEVKPPDEQACVELKVEIPSDGVTQKDNEVIMRLGTSIDWRLNTDLQLLNVTINGNNALVEGGNLTQLVNDIEKFPAGEKHELYIISDKVDAKLRELRESRENTEASLQPIRIPHEGVPSRRDPLNRK